MKERRLNKTSKHPLTRSNNEKHRNKGNSYIMTRSLKVSNKEAKARFAYSSYQRDNENRNDADREGGNRDCR